MKFITPVLIAACLSPLGCALKQPPQGAGILTENARANIPGGWSASSSSGKVVPGWIRSFGDTTLTAIVEDALARNPDLKAAAARVEASQSAVRVAAASLYPSIGLKGLRERQGRETQGNLGAGITPPDLGSSGVPNSGGGTDINTFDSSMGRWVTGIGIGASWEADVWGRVRSKKAAAKMDSVALEADYEYARQSLAASVVRAYISTIEAGQQAANAQETLALYEDYLKLTDARKKQGFSSEYEIAQLKSRMAGAEDSVYAADAAQAQAIRAIEVVTSHYPSGKLKTRRTFPVIARSVPSGMPSELLERRPDLIAAERRFAAAFHRSNEARTARIPRFAISATGGLGSAQLDGIGVIDAVSWSLAGGVTQPIFFGGELKAAEDIRKAEQRAAAAAYASSALRAFQDVEDALDSDYHLRRREGALNGMVEHSATATKLGKVQLDQGQTDMFTILRLVGENFAAKAQLTQVRASRLRERINLHLALGGDFKQTLNNRGVAQD